MGLYVHVMRETDFQEVASNATYDSLLDDVAGVGGKVLVDVLRRIQDETVRVSL